MPPVGIVTDSACDLPQDLVDQYGIEVVPLTIRFGDDEYVDRRDLTPKQFWALCRDSPQLPQTAAPSPGAFEQAYRALAARGCDGVVSIHLSGELSATIEAARAGARAVEDDLRVEVVDSRTVTIGLGAIVLEAARLAEAGEDLDAIVATARRLAERTRVFGALDTLENLKKGGRIGPAQSLLGSLLQIKPIIEVRNGVVEPAGKQRTRSKALQHLVQILADHAPVEGLAVMHADCADLDSFVAEIRRHHDGELVVGDIGAVIGSHAGPGTIGFTFRVPDA
jgi:DegV family protein with EDD domain